MNCIKCYQEISEGSKFCPHCGAEQPDTASAANTDAQANTAAQPDAAASQNTAAQPDAAASQDTAAQQDQNTQYQDRMHSIRILIRLIIRILSIRHRRYTSHPMSRRNRSTGFLIWYCRS